MFNLLKFAAATLLPVVFAVFFYHLEKKPSFLDFPHKKRQLIIGLAFGVLTIFANEFSISSGGVPMNVCDAAPLVAGLIFGGPAGIIAGIIGGMERWFAVYWGADIYTRTACTLGTILAGFLGAAVRKYMLDDKKPSWVYGLAMGITAEVMHMLLVFLTNISDIAQAFSVVKICAMPMITANGLSVMLSALVISRLGKEHLRKAENVQNISQTFQRWLAVCVLIAFACTGFLTYTLQNRLANNSADELLLLNMEDVRNDINEASDRNILNNAKEIALHTTIDTTSEELVQMAETYGIAEINLIEKNGIIIATTYPDFLGYDMASGKQSSTFIPLLKGTKSIVQSYQPTSFDPSLSRKYAGVAIEGGAIQIGYDAVQFQADIQTQVMDTVRYRHVGQDGYIVICDENWNVVRGKSGESTIQLTPIDTDLIPENTRYIGELYGENTYCVYTKAEGYYIITALPQSAAMFNRDIAVYILMFMEITVFASLFALVYFLIKRLVVDNIREINRSLAKITGGNLDVTVNVRSNEEFASLSDDINSTVVTLKRYISEAEARIDKELEFAKSIQHSALPSVFPPYPHRKDFEIFASMDTAKEVGGDFYDFYLLNDDRIAFLIADVSGKGIPAAMFMMTAKTLIKDFAESGMEVNDAFTRANAKLCEGNDAGMFVTAWMGYLDLKTGLLSYANAGHNPPVICRKDGTFEYLRTRPNFILAGMEGIKYKKHEMQLFPGDQIYLYTDGVTEAQDVNNQLYGEARLLDVLNNNRTSDVTSLCKAVHADVDVFAGEADQFDDITMLAFKLHFLKNGGTLTVSPDMASVSYVTDFLESQLEKLEVPMKVANRIKIATDEIYSNIVRYSGAESASVHCDIKKTTLSLIFRDNGKPYNPLENDDPDITSSAEDREIGGLGVFMVKKMMDSVEYEHTDGWNVLTMRMNI